MSLNSFNYVADGQMSIFDFMDETPATKPLEPLVMLQAGQSVYNVVKGDIYPYIVDKHNWICGDGNRGYDLTNEKGNHHVTWNNHLGICDFTDLDKAKEQARKNLAMVQHILAEDIKPVKVVAYEFEYYGRKNIYFYAIIQDGMIYRQSDGVYAHISNQVDIEIDNFERGMKSKEKQLGIKILEDYKPQFMNMYECKKDNWKYAEARYNHLSI